MERTIWRLDRIASLHNVMVAEIRGALSPSALREPLRRLARRHPLLRVKVSGVEPLRFIGDGVPELAMRVVARSSDTTWQEVFDEELNRPFLPSDAPLARVVLVSGEARSELLITFHHLIGDGFSGVIMLRELLADAGQLASGASLPELAPLPERPELGALMPDEARGVRQLPALRRLLGRTLAGRQARKLEVAAAPPEARRTRVSYHTLSLEQTSQLLARARAEGVTLQAVIAAALLLASAEDLALEEPAPIACFHAVSLRTRLAPPVHEDVGLFVSQATTYQVVGRAMDLWQVARGVRRELGAAIEEALFTLPMLGLFLPRWGDVQARLERRMDGASPASIGVTNLGRIQVPEQYGPLRLERLQAAPGLGLAAQLLVYSSTFGGRLTCNLMYSEPRVSAPRARQLHDRLLGRLGASLAPPPAPSGAPAGAGK